MFKVLSLNRIINNEQHVADKKNKHKHMNIVRILVIGLIVISLVACKNEPKKGIPNPSENRESLVIESISIDELKVLENNIQLVDVRTPEEFASGYIKNAININIRDKAFLESTVLLDKSKPVYVYCKAGSRSKIATKALRDAGFAQVIDVQGGFREWASSGNILSID
jgi:phage shock protein E